MSIKQTKTAGKRIQSFSSYLRKSYAKMALMDKDFVRGKNAPTIKKSKNLQR